jgi:hypothetical protein
MVAISLAFRCKQKRKEREGEKTISKEKRIWTKREMQTFFEGEVDMRDELTNNFCCTAQ